MDIVRDKANQYMNLLQQSGCNAACTYCSADDEGDIYCLILADPGDINVMDALFAMQIADYMTTCGLNPDEVAQFMGRLTLAVMNAFIEQRLIRGDNKTDF